MILSWKTYTVTGVKKDINVNIIPGSMRVNFIGKTLKIPKIMHKMQKMDISIKTYKLNLFALYSDFKYASSIFILFSMKSTFYYENYILPLTFYKFKFYLLINLNFTVKFPFQVFLYL